MKCSLTILRYLGSNSITVVEGLENLESLRELHIEKQSLPPGEKLLFEPRSLQALSVSMHCFGVNTNSPSWALYVTYRTC